MATLVLTDARVELDSNDISANVRQVTLSYEAEAVEDINMGDSTRIRLGGLKDWSVELELSQDFAASALDSILFPLVGTVVTAKVRPTSSAISTSNPEYSGSVLVQSNPPFGNSVGELATTGVSLLAAGDLSRATS